MLEVILREEVAHVAAGSRWYRWYCDRAGVEPRARFKELLVEYAGGYLHGPFNMEARLLAGSTRMSSPTWSNRPVEEKGTEGIKSLWHNDLIPSVPFFQAFGNTTRLPSTVGRLM